MTTISVVRSIEQQIDLYEDMIQEEETRLEFRLPKENNKKRPHTAEEAEHRRSIRRCRAERLSKPCRYCDTKEPLIDDVNGDCICSACGLVNDRAAAFSVGYADQSRVRVLARANPQLNYFRERMSQWRMAEPKIPQQDCDRLIAAYNGGHGRYDPASGILEFDPFLPKKHVRAIILRANLMPKKYTEKWLSIRCMLGAPRHPDPDKTIINGERLVDLMMHYFVTLARVWNDHRKEICDHCYGRTSQPSYNFDITQILLTIDLEAYKTHAPWFPLVSEDKQPQMFVYWAAICHYAEWPCYMARYRANGTVERMELPRLPPAYRIQQRVKSVRQAIKRRYLDPEIDPRARLPGAPPPRARSAA